VEQFEFYAARSLIKKQHPIRRVVVRVTIAIVTSLFASHRRDCGIPHIILHKKLEATLKNIFITALLLSTLGDFAVFVHIVLIQKAILRIYSRVVGAEFTSSLRIDSGRIPLSICRRRCGA
jgi:hypothetical protein